ncbi:MAG: hypothetical protein ACRD2G_17970 [Terriglobia bacterium]
MKKLAIIGAASAAILAMLAPHAAAQGCAMCYQNAAASGAKGQEALRHGILILLIPALVLFGGIFLAIYRRDDLSQ